MRSPPRRSGGSCGAGDGVVTKSLETITTPFHVANVELVRVIHYASERGVMLIAY